MYNVNDILARLQNGESADAIAQSFADALNGALQKQEEEKAAVAKRHEDKVAALTTVIDSVINFIKEFYPDAFLDFEYSTEDVESIIETLDNEIPKLKELSEALAELEALTKKPKTNSKPATLTATVSGDAITNFLKANGLM